MRISIEQLVLVLLLVGSGCGFDRARIEEARCTSFPCAPGCESTCDGSFIDGGRDGGIVQGDSGLPDANCSGADNACGGCMVLAGSPGDRCAEAPCGTWICNGTDQVSCMAGRTNGCGGCGTLQGAPGDPCGGSCGAALTCAGENALVCEGPQPNACGGCTAVAGAELGDLCACQGLLLDEFHEWECAGQDLVCADGNDTLNSPTVLSPVSDQMVDWVGVSGALVTGEQRDHFEVAVVDEGGGDGLFPLVELTGLSRDLNVCAYWFYEDGRGVNVRCPNTSWVITDEGHEGCCSLAAGVEDESIEMLNDSWGISRFDVLHGPENDDGWLVISVSGTNEDGCSPYELQYRF